MDTRMKETDTEAEIREMFKVFDMDGNGFISAEEFKWTMMNLGNQLTEEEVNEIIKTADLNGDGQIDLEGNFHFFFILFFFMSIVRLFHRVWYLRLFLFACQFCLHKWYNDWLTQSRFLGFIKLKVYVSFQANLYFLSLFTKPSP